jgi:hypothetical protein
MASNSYAEDRVWSVHWSVFKWHLNPEIMSQRSASAEHVHGPHVKDYGMAAVSAPQ